MYPLPYTYQGIAYNELHEGSGRISLGSSQGAQRQLVCTWADAVQFAILLRGWKILGPGSFQVVTPAVHPSNIGMYATDVSIERMGKPTGENTWENAKLNVSYLQLLMNVSLNSGPTTDLLDEALDFSAEMVDLGTDGWVYEGTSEKVDRQLQKIVPMVSYNITQYHVTTIPLHAIYTTLGCLNSSTFRGASSGQMLYAGASAQRKIVGSFNNVTYLDWTITHKFLYANRDLNSEWRTSTGAFQKVTGNGGATKFTYADFTALGLGS